METVVVIKEEFLTTESIQEIDNLSRLHWEEVSPLPFEYDPDWARYQLLNELGLIKVFVARLNDRIIGYNSYYMTTHLHNKNYAMAMQDTLFVHPAHRNGTVGMKLLLHAEEELKKLNIDLVIQTVTLSMDISAIFDRLGYEDLERTMIKQLH